MLTLQAVSGAESWLSGRRYIDRADTSEGSGSLALRAADENTQFSSFPGLTLNLNADVWVKSFETAMTIDVSDINSHSFSIFVNPLGAYNSRPDIGTSFIFSVADPSFSYRTYNPNGSPDPSLIISFKFETPLHITAGQTWVLSAVMNLNQGEGGSYAANAVQLETISSSATQDRIWTSYGGADQVMRPWAVDAFVSDAGTIVPEPGPLALLAAGGALFGFCVRRRAR